MWKPFGFVLIGMSIGGLILVLKGYGFQRSTYSKGIFINPSEATFAQKILLLLCNILAFLMGLYALLQ